MNINKEKFGKIEERVKQQFPDLPAQLRFVKAIHLAEDAKVDVKKAIGKTTATAAECPACGETWSEFPQTWFFCPKDGERLIKPEAVVDKGPGTAKNPFAWERDDSALKAPGYPGK